ncbi:hAT family dimerization protein [Rhizoctonia solani]|uniref:HAT family dimerization protein n=1 Tax=Rhizoctonia solani TaxID=456999 RepID=A0A8H8SYC6_9AGAM|nr:hAT family dimerization protein [Rhizoctonia solani]QRW23051.1 hAT family dimerization protein [Rhizoctonia solani]
MIHVWSGLLAYKTPNSGCHQLAHLAIHVLSIVANLAGCKQLFSKMGHIHTKWRNWLGYQKVFDTAVVRMDLKRKHADEGRTHSRLKCQFGSPALDSVVLGAGTKRNNQPNKLAESIGNVNAIKEELVTPSVHLLITQLCQDVLNDEDPLDDKPNELPIATLPKKVWLFFGTQFPIPLHDLFDYSGNTESEVHRLDFFKSNRLNNLDAELELYGLVTWDIQKGLEIDDSTI